MSVIPSTRGPGGGLRRLIYAVDAVSNPATDDPDVALAWTDATDVRGYDEVVLNIECIANFATGVVGATGHEYAEKIMVSMMYSTTNAYTPPAVSPEFWSPLLAEEIETPFTGFVETADYVIKLEDLETDVMNGPTVTGSLGRILRFPVTMATWVFFKIIVDKLGDNPTLNAPPGTADDSTYPIFKVKLYRGLAL